MGYNVCLHEQNDTFRDMLITGLIRESWKVKAFKTGGQLCSHISDHPHVWVVDADDPAGFKVIKELKKAENAAPIIATSEHERVINRVLGLELGCADFVVKPFLTRELVLRIQRVLTPPQPGSTGEQAGSTVMLQKYCINPLRRCVNIEGQKISLTAKEFNLLLLFLRHQGMALSREQIIRAVWGENYCGSERAADDLIRRIRKKFIHLKVETLHGYGYLMRS